MSKKVIVALLVGFALGVLITPYVLASGHEETNEHEWCFRQQFDSQKHFDEFRHEQPRGSEFDNVFIKLNGRKYQVFTKCESTPLPYRYAP